MFNRMVVQEALIRTWALENYRGRTPDNSSDDQSSVTSQLIYDIFGGEILKSHKKHGWHFYNRINGKRVDFIRSKLQGPHKVNYPEDLPSSPDETTIYFAQEDYLTFFTRFLRAFEEVVGLRERHYKLAV